LRKDGLRGHDLVVVASVGVTLEVHGVNTAALWASVVLECVVEAGKGRAEQHISTEALGKARKEDKTGDAHLSQMVSWLSAGKPVHPTLRSGNW
jgi:hypothetical protein